MEKIYYPNNPDAGFSVRHTKMPAHANMKEHYHDFYEIYYFLDGEMNYFIEDKPYNVRKHDMIFIDRFTYHKTFYKETSERVLMEFYDSNLDLIGTPEVKGRILSLFSRKKLSFTEEFNKYIVESLFDRILPAYYRPDSQVSLIRAKLLFCDLLLAILEKCEEGAVMEDESGMNPQEKRVSEIVSYINSNYRNDISLEQLCSRFYINKYYLCHIFKKVTGVSIVDFINRKRLAEAERLLRYSSLKITEISGDVGFKNVNYFIGLFKNKYNCTPKAFREHLYGVHTQPAASSKHSPT